MTPADFTRAARRNPGVAALLDCLPSAGAGIDRFLVAGTAVGIATGTGAVYAPYGLDDLAAGLLRINPRHPRPTQFRAKAADYIRR